MLESGCVSVKNEVNIMMKNIIDVVLGGFTYWVFGYGLSYGRGELTNPFVAIGDFFIDPGVDDPLMGQIFASFLFQLSFSTTATTIVSGAMAERLENEDFLLGFTLKFLPRSGATLRLTACSRSSTQSSTASPQVGCGANMDFSTI